MADNEDYKPEAPRALPLKTGAPAPVPAMRPAEVPRPLGRDINTISQPGSISGPDGKKLIVGREIELSGNISACDKLVVEGKVEANISDCREIEVAASGTFKGEAEINVAEISGIFEGNLTARDILFVRSTGRVTGKVRFGKLEIERGGEIVGDVGTYAAADAETAETETA
ncbi:MAG: polymer-forming cytoskeletal protein [Alphaproteobacteria bacterium]